MREIDFIVTRAIDTVAIVVKETMGSAELHKTLVSNSADKSSIAELLIEDGNAVQIFVAGLEDLPIIVGKREEDGHLPNEKAMKVLMDLTYKLSVRYGLYPDELDLLIRYFVNNMFHVYTGVVVEDLSKVNSDVVMKVVYNSIRSNIWILTILLMEQI